MEGSCLAQHHNRGHAVHQPVDLSADFAANGLKKSRIVAIVVDPGVKHVKIRLEKIANGDPVGHPEGGRDRHAALLEKMELFAVLQTTFDGVHSDGPDRPGQPDRFSWIQQETVASRVDIRDRVRISVRIARVIDRVDIAAERRGRPIKQAGVAEGVLHPRQQPRPDQAVVDHQTRPRPGVANADVRPDRVAAGSQRVDGPRLVQHRDEVLLETPGGVGVDKFLRRWESQRHDGRDLGRELVQLPVRTQQVVQLQITTRLVTDVEICLAEQAVLPQTGDHLAEFCGVKSDPAGVLLGAADIGRDPEALTRWSPR